MSRHKWRIDSSKATKVELGVHCGVASFSNRARWAAIGLLLLATGLFLVVGLTAHTGSFALPEESDFGGVLLLLSEQTGIVCGILLLSMLCCGEGPTASVPGMATAPRQCGRGCDFDPRVPSNAARYATAAALVALGIVASSCLPSPTSAATTVMTARRSAAFSWCCLACQLRQRQRCSSPWRAV